MWRISGLCILPSWLKRWREGEKRGGLVYKGHNLHVIFGVTLMAVLGTSSITPAFPEIRDALGISSGQVGLLMMLLVALILIR